ncbi:hypothetical protein DFO62_102261 [Serratia fonticola]|nr:hypothetical protein DFO62_102261 [Serratia fonticola]
MQCKLRKMDYFGVLTQLVIGVLLMVHVLKFSITN